MSLLVSRNGILPASCKASRCRPVPRVVVSPQAQGCYGRRPAMHAWTYGSSNPFTNAQFSMKFGDTSVTPDMVGKFLSKMDSWLSNGSRNPDDWKDVMKEMAKEWKDAARDSDGNVRDSDSNSNLQVPFDIIENDTEYVAKADIPGISKDALKIQLLPDNYLSVSGERTSDFTADAKVVKRMERRFGKFSRKFKLAKDANTDEIKAQVRDGVLTITVAKVPQEQRDISIS